MSDMRNKTLPARARKSRTLYFRVTPGEQKRVELAARRSGKFTLSEWLRDLVLREADAGWRK